MTSVNIEEILEDARWEAEFGEGRFSTAEKVPVAIWIRRTGVKDIVCHFDNTEKAYNFGFALLLKDCPDFTLGCRNYTSLIGYNSTLRVEMCVGFTPAGATVVTEAAAAAAAVAAF